MISIIVPCYNLHERTNECLNAVLNTVVQQDVEIIVVDNGSNPPIKPPYSGFVETRIIRNEENLGFPKAVNQGIKEAKGDIIFLLNNDVVVTNGAIYKMADALNDYSIVGCRTNFCAGVQRDPEANYSNPKEMEDYAEQLAEEYEYDSFEVNYVIGFFMAFKKSLFEEIGEFDESMWPSSGEEVDFCFRAREKGHKIGVLNGVYVHHYGSETFKDLQASGLVDYAELCQKVDKHVGDKWGMDYWNRQIVHKASYLIFAPPYLHKSAGVRALYRLNEELSTRGHLTRVVEFGSKEKASPDEIVIYPEIVNGNPLGGKTVVRYVLNYPGEIGGDNTYNSNEIIFAYHEKFYPNVPVLTVPVIEDFFRNEGVERSGGCFWVGKGGSVQRVPETEGLTEITYEWPETREELAWFLNRKSVLFSYDNNTMLIQEAKKCGCQVVIIGDELKHEENKDFDSQIDYFIEVTQEAAQHRSSETYLAIGVPLTFPFVPSAFFKSYALMEKPTHFYIQADNGGICGLRNNIVERALHEGCTHLIMMDVDQVYPVDTIPKLLSHSLPVVGARVHRRYPPYDSLMLRIEEVDERTNKYVSVDEWEEGELVEVDATGGGCVMFNLDVFRKLPYPWFKEDKEGVGEDIRLFQDIKEAGYRIFVDSSIEVGHLATMIVNKKTNLLFRSMKERQHKENLAKALQAA